MHQLHTQFCIWLLLLPCVVFAGNHDLQTTEINKKPLYFIENKGQIKDPEGNISSEVLYMIKQNDLSVFIYRDGISYTFEQLTNTSDQQNGINSNDELLQTILCDEFQKSTHRVNVKLLGANSNATVIASQQAAYFENYYNDPQIPEGITNVRAFEKITIKNIYPGINWVLYSNNNALKYDFEVTAGADASLIQMQIQDAFQSTVTSNTSFQIVTALGEINDNKLFCYEKESKNTVVSSFKLQDNILRFNLDNYNKNNTLIIDPELTWSTYVGGEGEDAANAVAMDADEFIYTTGYTSSATGMSESGFQMTYGGGAFDAYLAKFDSLGNKLWCTYYGGNKADYGTSLCYDETGHIYIIGTTNSNMFPTFEGFQDTHGGSYDAFLVKFDTNGNRIWSTYYGGSGYDAAKGVVVDGNNNICITGSTTSSNNIAFGGHQNVNGGLYDAFIVKFTPEGDRIWGTYYGGTEDDESRAICVNSLNDIFITGLTKSTTNIALDGYDNFFGANNDVYIAKFTSEGILDWGTYYGGTQDDNGNGIQCDEFNNVYVAIQSNSTTGFDCNGYDLTNNGENDAVFAKFANNGNLIWATYFGGSEDDYGKALYVKNNFVYVTGYTSSLNNIAEGGIQDSINGLADAFIVKFTYDGEFNWSTYFGSTGDEYGRGILSNKISTIYFVGKTFSATNIAYKGMQETYGGGPADGFVLKINECEFKTTYYTDEDGDGYGIGTDSIISCFPLPGFANNILDCNDEDFNINPSSIETCDAIDEDCNGLIDDDVIYTIYYSDNDNDLFGNVSDPGTLFCIFPGSGFVLNNSDCNDANSLVFPGASEICNGIDDDCNLINDDVYINTTISASGPLTFCQGGSVILSVQPALSYQWKKNGVNIAGATSLNYTATKTGNYTVSVTIAGGCNALSAATTVTVNQKPAPAITALGSLDICATGSVKLKTALKTGSVYQWYFNGSIIVGATSNVYIATAAGSYYVKETNAAGCNKSSLSVIVSDSCKKGDVLISTTEFNIYPNPATDQITIDMEFIDIINEGITLQLINELGQIILQSKEELNSDQLNTTINLPDAIVPGIYLLNVVTSDNIYSNSVMIIK